MKPNFNKLLVANRGEIAVRIIRAAQELGLQTVAVFSTADKESLAVKMADEAVEIGGAQAHKSYLKIDAVIEAAIQTKAEAIHPGYGFLSENAEFSKAVEAAGMYFIGPSHETIRAMGDKATAIQAAVKAGVPVVPGSGGEIQHVEQALEVAQRIGYPLLIKATAGGGGRGIRKATNAAQLAEQMSLAQAEARAAFGNGGVYLERFIERSRHVEVQILGDGKNVIHLYERDCSIQRRRQKIFEEAPSPALDEKIRTELCQSAIKLAKAVNYRGAGTLEYLYDAETRQFYFIEMNTRIQVEHPITELITGIDLVREMIRVCGGLPLGYQQSDVHRRGHAIEVRINAEDPDNNFRPSPGEITELSWPSGPGVRIDSMLYPHYQVPPYYDSMLAKLIVWDENRECALRRLRRALKEVQVGGIKTTTPLFLNLLDHEDVLSGKFDTNWLERWMSEKLTLKTKEER